MLRKKKSFKSIISLVLVILLLISCFPITASAKTKITDIEIEPITIIEGTFGDYDSNDGYFKYYPEDLFSYTVTFEDGQTYSSEGYSFEYDGEWYWFETETDQSIDNTWTVGNTYTMTVSLSGVSVDVPVTITDTVINDIVLKPAYIIEYTHGEWQVDFNDEKGEYERSYYYYDYNRFIEGTIYFTDGTSTEFNDSFEYNGETYWISAFDDQSAENPWFAGNEYSVEIEAMGVKASMPVTIEETPVKSIEIAPITVTEFTNGDYYNNEGEFCYIYNVRKMTNFTVTFENGEVVSDCTYGLEYEDYYYRLEVIDDQTFDNQWKAGETYTVTAEFMGYTVDAEVSIEDTPVQSIEIEPIYIYEGSEGFIYRTYDSNTDEYLDAFYVYNPCDLMEYTVTFEDGEVVSDVGVDVYYGEERYKFDMFATQSYDNQWTAGNTYDLYVFLTGVEAVVEVTILESPVESIELEPIEIVEGTSSDYVYEYNPETNEYDLEYLCYYPQECLKYTVTFKDGTVVSDTGYQLEYKGRLYEFEAITDQSYKNQWLVGNTYNYTVNLMNFEAEGEATIVSSPVRDIEFEPISIPVGTGGLYTWDYIDETDSNTSIYYLYSPEDFMKYTITFNDGSTYQGTGDMFKYNSYLFWMEVETDQSYDNQWTVGNTYTMTVTVDGKVYYVDVEITESLVESIEIKPFTVYEGIDGCNYGDFDPDTGEFIGYYHYYLDNVVEYTITLKDGTVINGSGSEFEYDGNYYEIAVISDQSFTNPWEIGNTYTAEFLCMGETVDIEVTVKDYVEGDINFDGVANISDVTYLQKCLAGLIEFTDRQCGISDMNWDGVVTITDATELQKLLAGF